MIDEGDADAVARLLEDRNSSEPGDLHEALKDLREEKGVLLNIEKIAADQWEDSPPSD